MRLGESGEPEIELLDWGFQPTWAKRAWINARSETVFDSKAFAPAARKRRCLVPAIGWYEWQGARAPKQPYVLHLDGFVPFSFAGIWTARETEKGWRGNYAILTKQATESIRKIHGRMPVVLNLEFERKWLDPELTAAGAMAMLEESSAPVKTYAVSTFVNKPANNSAKCIEAVA